MEFEAVLKQSLKDVEAAAVPADLKAFAFAEAVKHYTTQFGGAAPPPGMPKQNAETSGSSSGPARQSPSDDLFGRVADETGVPREDLERVFYVDNGDAPAFNISARKLGANKSDRHRAIALLMTCMRHYGLDETEVDIEVIREICISMGTYDSANFSTLMGSVPGITLSGPRGKKVLRPRPAESKTKFKEKVSTILGGSESAAD